MNDSARLIIITATTRQAEWAFDVHQGGGNVRGHTHHSTAERRERARRMAAQLYDDKSVGLDDREGRRHRVATYLPPAT